MKVPLLLSAIITAMLSPGQSMANDAVPSTVTCTSGVMGEESFVRVTLDRRSIEFTMHEAHITVKRSDARTNRNTIAVLDKAIKGSVEGDEFTARVSALLVYNPSTKSLNTTLVLDGRAHIAAQILSCK